MHEPVLLKEVLEQAQGVVDKVDQPLLIDLTLGYAGHSKAFFELLSSYTKDGTLLSVEWDSKAINFVLSNYDDVTQAFHYDAVKQKLIPFQKVEGIGVPNPASKVRWIVVKSNFVYIKDVLRKLQEQGAVQTNTADLILADLGVSTPQLEDVERGFSFHSPGTADMRMDPDTYSLRAADLLNALSETELKRLFVSTVGMPIKLAQALAWRIVVSREEKPFGDNTDIKRLTRIAEEIKPLRRGALKRLHPATLLFLALRIAVNMELLNLKELLQQLPVVLHPKGRALIIGFHSAEWQILEAYKDMTLVDVIEASTSEVQKNPRARSAKMFVFENVK